jgi:hypothetical protein
MMRLLGSKYPHFSSPGTGEHFLPCDVAAKISPPPALKMFTCQT